MSAPQALGQRHHIPWGHRVTRLLCRMTQPGLGQGVGDLAYLMVSFLLAYSGGTQDEQNVVSVWWQQSRMASEEGSLAERCSSCTTCRVAACKRICCCFNCTVLARKEAGQVQGQLCQPGGHVSRGRTSKALGKGAWQGRQHGTSARKRARAAPKGATLTQWGSVQLPQSSTARQSRGHAVSGQEALVWALLPEAECHVWGLALLKWVLAPFRPQKTPNQPQTGFCCFPLSYSLFWGKEEIFAASLGVKQEPCSQEREGLSVQEGK